ncbi:transposase, partial [Halalkalibacterium halodurans]|nr:transposase [Halalkalibacterium halodurans]
EGLNNQMKVIKRNAFGFRRYEPSTKLFYCIINLG